MLKKMASKAKLSIIAAGLAECQFRLQAAAAPSVVGGASSRNVNLTFK